jgi:hypothetical protein
MSKDKMSRASEEAMLEHDAHQAHGNQGGPEERKLQEEFHDRSHATHLDTTGKQHTKPEGNLRQGSAPGARRQPPEG